MHRQLTEGVVLEVTQGQPEKNVRSESYEISILNGYKEETLSKDRHHKKKPEQYH